jgi:hypothetical protein
MGGGSSKKSAAERLSLLPNDAEGGEASSNTNPGDAENLPKNEAGEIANAVPAILPTSNLQKDGGGDAEEATPTLLKTESRVRRKVEGDMAKLEDIKQKDEAHADQRLEVKLAKRSLSVSNGRTRTCSAEPVPAPAPAPTPVSKGKNMPPLTDEQALTQLPALREYGGELAARAAVSDRVSADVERVMNRLPPPSANMNAKVDPFGPKGIGQGCWQSAMFLELIQSQWTGGDGDYGGHSPRTSGNIGVTEAVLKSPHLRALLENFDSRAFKSVQWVLDVYRRSGRLQCAWYSSEWAGHLRKMQAGDALVTNWGWFGHCIALVVEKIDAHTIRHTTCNSGDGLGYHSAGLREMHEEAPRYRAKWGGKRCADSIEVPLEKYCEPFFRDTMAQSRFTSCVWSNATNFYTGLATAGGMCTKVDGHMEQNKQLAKDPKSNCPMSGQKGADCWFKGPQRAFRYLLYRSGLNKKQARELKVHPHLHPHFSPHKPHDLTYVHYACTCITQTYMYTCIIYRCTYMHMCISTTRSHVSLTVTNCTKVAIRVALLEQVISDMRASFPNGDNYFESDMLRISICGRQVARHFRQARQAGLFQQQANVRAVVDTLLALDFQKKIVLTAHLPQVVQPSLALEDIVFEESQTVMVNKVGTKSDESKTAQGDAGKKRKKSRFGFNRKRDSGSSSAAVAVTSAHEETQNHRTLHSFPELRLLRHSVDRSFLAGTAGFEMATSPPPYLSISQRVISLEDALEALTTATAVGSAILTEASEKMNSFLCYKAAVVLEDTVLRLLPGASSYVWGHLKSRKLQQDLIHAFVRTATVYMSASLSFPPDDREKVLTRTRRLGTMLKLLSLFDVVIRKSVAHTSVHASKLGVGRPEGQDYTKGLYPEGFDPSLADVLNNEEHNFVLDVDSEVVGRGLHYAKSEPWAYRLLSDVTPSFLAEDGAVAASVGDAAVYFKNQRSQRSSPQRLMVCRYSSSSESCIVSFTPDQFDESSAEGRPEGINKFVDVLLQELAVSKDYIPPCLYKVMGTNEIEPSTIKGFFRTGAWIDEFAKVLPEFNQLLTMSMLYRLAFKMANARQKVRWTKQQGEIINPPASASIVALDFCKFEVDPGMKYDFLFELNVFNASMHPLKVAVWPSYNTMIKQTLQVQAGETPQTDPFTEDSVLYTNALPSFDSTLSEEDSEAMLSCLSVGRLRVPLVLDFFSHGRVGTLLNVGIQRLVVGALFEMDELAMHIANVEAYPQEDPVNLASTRGLLMEEIQHSPELVLSPLLRMVTDAANAGARMSYKAPYLSLVFFLNLVCCRVLSFVAMDMELSGGSLPVVDDFVLKYEASVVPLLLQWANEAAGDHDYDTASVIRMHIAFAHACFVLFRKKSTDAEYALGYMAYAEAWEGTAMEEINDTAHKNATANVRNDDDSGDEELQTSGVVLTVQEVFYAYQRVRLRVASIFSAVASNDQEALASMCVRVAGFSVGTGPPPFFSTSYLRPSAVSSPSLLNNHRRVPPHPFLAFVPITCRWL